MAKKLQKANAKRTTMHQQNYSTKWLRNAMKSVGISTREVFKDISPNIYEATSAGVNTSKNIVSALRSNKAGVNRVNDQLASNKYVQIARSAYKNAMSDIKSGNFNNEARQEEAILNSSGMDDLNELTDGFSFGDDGAESNPTINYIAHGGNNDAMISMSNQMRDATTAQLKTQKASMDAYVAVSAAGMQQVGQLGSDILGELANVNNNLAAIVQYNNENMSRFIEASIAYYDRAGASLDAKDSSSSSDNKKLSARDVLNGDNGGLNVSQYKAYVKQQFKEMAGKSDAGMMLSMINDPQMLEVLASNPLGFMSKGLVQYMMPKMVKSTLEGLETTFSNFVPNMLSQLADWGDAEGNSFGQSIKRMIGQTFGLKTERIKTLNGATIERGAIPFDGETKHAITEIITKELREQTGYLGIIAKHYDKKARSKMKANAEFWDYRSNSYIKGNKIDSGIVSEIVDSVTGAFKTTGFGKSMGSLVARQDKQKKRKVMDEAVQQLFIEIEKQGKTLYLPDLLDIIDKVGYSDSVQKALETHVKDMAEKDPNSFNSLNVARHNSQSKANEAKQYILDHPTEFHLFNSSFNGKKKNADGVEEDLDVDEVLSQVRKYRSGKGRMKSVDMSPTENQMMQNMFGSASNHAIQMMNTMMKGGDASAFIEQGASMIADQVKIIGGKISKTLFGEKEQDGYRDGGIFSEFSNGFSDTMNMMKHSIFGKAYKDSKGVMHEETEDTVISNFKRIGADIKQGVKEKFSGIFGHASEALKNGLNGWTDALFGTDQDEDPDKAREDQKKKIIETLKKSLPNTITGGAIGSGVGMVSGGLLNMLIGGPIGGAAIGATMGFLSKNEKFMNWMFGDEDENGNRIGGVISKKTQDFFKQNKTTMAGGAAVGMATSVITGKTGGVLGMLVGGPLAGALMGTAGALMAKSKTFQNFLYGNEETGQKGIFEAVKDAFNKHNKASQEHLADGGKSAGMGALGAGAGMITSAILGKMGILGAALSPLGPIGGAVLGLGLSIKAQSGNFKEWLFGKEDGLSLGDGKKAKKQGVVGQIGNILNANLLKPLATRMNFFAKDAMITLEHDVLAPFSFAAEMLAGKAGDIVSGVKDGAARLFNGVGENIKKGFEAVFGPSVTALKTAIDGVTTFAYKSIKAAVSLPGLAVKAILSKPAHFLSEKVFKPIGNLISDTRTLIFSGIGTVVKSALHVVGGVGKVLTYPLRAVGGFAGRMAQNAASKLQDKIIRARGHVGEFIGGSKEDDIYTRWRTQQKIGKQQRAELKLEQKNMKRHDKNSKIIAKYTKGQFSEDSDEARQYLKLRRPEIYFKYFGDASNTSQTREDANKKEAREGAHIDSSVSADQLSRMNPDKIDADGRKVYYLQGIFNILRGKKWNGDDKDEGDNSQPETVNETLAREERERKEAEKAERLRQDENSAYMENDMRDAYSANEEWERNHPEEAKRLAKLRKQSTSAGAYLKYEKQRIKNFFSGHTDEENGEVISKNWGGRQADFLRDLGSGLSDDFKSLHITKGAQSLLQKFGVRGHAAGGQTEPGLNIVGENGAEAIVSGGKDTVYPNGKAVPVTLVNANKAVMDNFSENISNSVESAVSNGASMGSHDSDGDINDDGSLSKSELKERNDAAMDKAKDNAKTAKELQDEKQAEKDKDSEKKSKKSLFSTVKDNAKATISHAKEWAGMLGKKGLITLAVLGGIAFLKDKIPQIMDVIGNVASVLGSIAKKILDFAGGAASNIVHQGLWTYENDVLKNGETVGERTQANIDRGINPFDENDNADHQTTARLGLLARLGLNVKNSAYHLFPESRLTKNTKAIANGTKKTGKTIKDGAASVYHKVTGTKSIQDAAMSYQDEAVEGALKNGDDVARAGASFVDNAAEMQGDAMESYLARNADDAVKTGASLADDAAEAVAKHGDDVVETVAHTGASMADDVAETAGKKKGLLSKVCGYIKQFFDFVLSKFNKEEGTKATTSIFKKLKPSKVIEVVKEKWNKIATKIAEKLNIKGGAAAVTAGLSEVVFTTMGAINGLSGTAKLFHVKKEDVDGTMKTIATIFGAVASTTIGGVIDVVSGLIYDILGIDLLSATATALYGVIAGDDKAAKLGDAQSAFEDSYTKYQQGEIDKQYETQKKAGLIDPNMSKEEFSEKAHSGEIKVAYDSFADYNTNQNASIGDNMSKGIGKIWKGTKNAFKFIKSGGKKTIYTDKDGNTYQLNDKGLYDVTDKDGNSLGTIAKDALPSDATKSEVSAIGDAKQKASDMLSSVKTSASNAVKSIGGVFNNIFTGFGKLKKSGDAAKDLSKANDNNYWTQPYNNPKGIAETLSNLGFTMTRALNWPFYQMSKGIDGIKERAGKAFDGIKKILGIDILEENANKKTNGGKGGRGNGPDTVNGSAYYSQNDPRWKNAKYNTGQDNATMGDSGCGPAAMAMAASDATGRNINPMQMARLAELTGDRDDTGTNWNFINKASGSMGLDSHQALNPSANYISSQLASGHPVVLSGTSGGRGSVPYTKGGHYVVATGQDRNGNLIVNDPRGKQYSGKYNINDVANHTGSAWSIGGHGNGRSKWRFGGRGQTIDTKGTTAMSVGMETGGTSTKPTVGPMAKLQDTQSDREKFVAVVKSVKQAVAEQRPTYSSGNISINVGGKDISMRTDCSGFVSACLQAFDVLSGTLDSGSIASQTGPMAQTGFSYMAWPGWDALQEGDILAINGHTEIFARNENGRHMVYNGGSTGALCNPGATGTGHASGYDTVWCPGPAGANASLASSSTTAGGVTTDSSSSSGGSLWERLKTGLGNFFTEFGNRAMSGVLTGDWSNTDYSGIWGDSTSSTGSSTSGAPGSSSVTAANISGSDDAEKTWNYLRSQGMSEEGVAGLMGNLYKESGIRANNLQNSYESSLGSDEQYTANVDNNSYGNFVGDSAGYGLAQWTSSGRKQGLYDAAKANNTSIGDIGTQLGFLWSELSGGYQGVLNQLMNATDIQTASTAVLTGFEKPADQGAAEQAQRASFGQTMYNLYHGKTGEVTTDGEASNGTSGATYDTSSKATSGGTSAKVSATDAYVKGLIANGMKKPTSSTKSSSTQTSTQPTIVDQYLNGGINLKNNNNSTSSGNSIIDQYFGGKGGGFGTGGISGTSENKKVWNYLRSHGMSEAGVAGLMGNLYKESGIKTNNLQDSCEASLGSDDQYTSSVDTGTYGNFVNDSAGYGLAQWTSADRKQKLLDLTRSRGKSISDADTQLDYLWSELNGGYKHVLDNLMNASDIRTASNTVLTKFEEPADQGPAEQDERAGYGQSMYDLYHGSTSGRNLGSNGGGFGSGNIKKTNRIQKANGSKSASIAKKNYYKPYSGGGGFGNTPTTTSEATNDAKVAYTAASQSPDTSSAEYQSANAAKNFVTTSVDSTVNQLLTNAVQILATIATSVSSADGKLDALKALSNLGSLASAGGGTNIVTTGNGATSGSPTVSNPINGNVQTTPTRSDQTAYNIAKGGY